MVKKPSSNSSKGKQTQTQTQTQTHNNNPIPIRETRSKTSTSIKGKSVMKPCRTSKAKPEKAVEYVVIEDDGIEVDDMFIDDDDVYEDELDDGDDEEEEDYGFDADDDSDKGTDQNELSYSVLSEDDIRNRQEEDITAVTSVLSLSRDYACILLTYYNWSVGAVHEAWFADEEKVRKDVGLLEETVVWDRNGRGFTCGVCFEKYRGKEMCDVGCGHLFCNACWTGYLSTSINDGPGCLTLRCPDPSCGAAVGKDLVDSLVDDEGKEKYSRFLLRSYVEANRKTKWCPGPGCEYAVDYVAGSGNYDVSCNCTCTFCWNCLEDAHRPVDCDTVSKWVLKNTAEAENTNWILANSKPCPKCKRAIEKNNGCMHMTCTPPCRFQFCWLCLGDWKEHGKGTGGFYACNRYEAAKKEGAFDESEKIREMARKSLQRYTHYYERWAANQKSRDKAVEDLRQAQSVYIDRLSSNQCQLKSQLKFITEAWQQIIECRRVLKWTYAYGYYLPEHEQAKRKFFEYLQGEAEYALERLHKCAEKDIEVFLQGDEQIDEFGEFRIKLTNLTNSTRNFFENLVQALENGLADVASGSICPNTASSKHLEEGKKRKGEKSKGSSSRPTASSRRQGVNPPNIVSASHSLGVNPQIPVAPSRGLGVDPPNPVAPSRSQGVNPPNPVAPSRSQVVGPPVPVFAPNPVPASSIQVENPSNSAAANLSQEDSGPWACEHCTYSNDTASITCQVCSRPRISWSCAVCTFLNGESAAECHMCGEPR